MPDSDRSHKMRAFFLFLALPVLTAAGGYYAARETGKAEVQRVRDQAVQDAARAQEGFDSAVSKLKQDAAAALARKDQESKEALLALQEKHSTEMEELKEQYRQELLAERLWWMDKTRSLAASPQRPGDDVQVRLELLGGESPEDASAEEADTMFYEAMDLIIEGRYVEAAGKLEAVLHIDPAHAEASKFLANVRKTLQRINTAY